MTVRICYLNRWRNGTVLAQSSQHPQFPSTNTQLDSKKYYWRSRNGTGSGNGLFVVDANNKYIDFNEGAGEIVGTLTEGNYTALSLIEHIASVMTTRSAAVGNSWTYQGTFSEATGKATIEETAGPNNFSILWKTGTHGSDNADNHIGTTIGYDDSADDNGAAAFFLADYVRVHYPKAYIEIDLGAAYEINFVALLNHNIETGSTVKATGADDSAFSVNVVNETITWNATNLYHFFSSAQTKRYWRIHIEDINNADGYIQIGTIFLGKYFEPTRHYTNFFTRGKRDPSDSQASDASVLYSSDKDDLEVGSFPFEGLASADKTEIDAMLAECKRNKAFVIVHDSDNPNDDSFLMRMEELEDTESPHYQKYNWTLTCIEVV